MMKYELIEENKEYIVINKPAGLLTHGADHIKEESLIDQILLDYPDIAEVGDDPSRPGIMHRLDKLASGIIVLARSMDSFDNLKSQFKQRKVAKYYRALAFGKIEKDHDEINFPIKRSTKGYKMAALPFTDRGEKNPDGRNALTQFWVEKNYINYTLLKVKIKTGRTHQIRVHLSAYGHPLVGDDIYGTKKTRIKNKKLALDRIFLVAYKLEFKNLAGEKKTYEIEMPVELDEFLKKVK
jgi:23S rRNA pseudouridine1911/1915/1917 synthase